MRENIGKCTVQITIGRGFCAEQPGMYFIEDPCFRMNVAHLFRGITVFGTIWHCGFFVPHKALPHKTGIYCRKILCLNQQILIPGRAQIRFRIETSAHNPFHHQRLHAQLLQLLFIRKKQRGTRNLLQNALHRLRFYLSAKLIRKLCKFRCFAHNIVDRRQQRMLCREDKQMIPLFFCQRRKFFQSCFFFRQKRTNHRKECGFCFCNHVFSLSFSLCAGLFPCKRR